MLSQERRAELAPGEKLPSVSALFKEAAPKYHELAAHERAELAAKADEQRASYPDILAAYMASLTPGQIKEENVLRTRRRKAGLSHKGNLRIPGAPKQPLTGFMRFSTETREQRPEVLEGKTNILEQSKLVAAAWRALPDEKKEVSLKLPVATASACGARLTRLQFAGVQRRVRQGTRGILGREGRVPGQAGRDKGVGATGATPRMRTGLYA